MSTSNFKNMDNFDLWAVSDNDFYYKYCPECGFSAEADADKCSECGADLCDVVPEYDDLSAEILYRDIQAAIDPENENLLFHEISIISGYYTGLQLYVSLNRDADNAGFTERGPEYVDNESARYYFDMYRSQVVRRFEAEQRKINRILEKIGRAYGMDKLAIYARFSNGETWYTKTA